MASRPEHYRRGGAADYDSIEAMTVANRRRSIGLETYASQPASSASRSSDGITPAVHGDDRVVVHESTSSRGRAGGARRVQTPSEP